jgi:hypothetical protein
MYSKTKIEATKALLHQQAMWEFCKKHLTDIDKLEDQRLLAIAKADIMKKS